MSVGLWSIIHLKHAQFFKEIRKPLEKRTSNSLPKKFQRQPYNFSFNW
ncbi:hypothetical protein ACU8KH_02808 [Lachancea thermotolerans]